MENLSKNAFQYLNEFLIQNGMAWMYIVFIVIFLIAAAIGWFYKSLKSETEIAKLEKEIENLVSEKNKTDSEKKKIDGELIKIETENENLKVEKIKLVAEINKMNSEVNKTNLESQEKIVSIFDKLNEYADKYKKQNKEFQNALEKFVDALEQNKKNTKEIHSNVCSIFLSGFLDSFKTYFKIYRDIYKHDSEKQSEFVSQEIIPFIKTCGNFMETINSKNIIESVDGQVLILEPTLFAPIIEFAKRSSANNPLLLESENNLIENIKVSRIITNDII